MTHDQEDANAIADRIAVLDQGCIQQVGVPIDLYDHPANRFVATFLGTANLIEGNVEPVGRFVADGLTLDGIGGVPGPACIAIRPQDVAIEPMAGGIEAIVRKREFLGAITRYRVQVGKHLLVVDATHHRDLEAFLVGASVRIRIDSRQAAVLR